MRRKDFCWDVGFQMGLNAVKETCNQFQHISGLSLRVNRLSVCALVYIAYSYHFLYLYIYIYLHIGLRLTCPNRSQGETFFCRFTEMINIL